MEKRQYQTAGRACLVEYLQKNAEKAPQSADEIYAGLCAGDATGKKPGRSSVYRMLSALAEQGEVKKFAAGDERGVSVYQYVGERACQHHFHLQCLVCGEVSHLECGCSDEIAAHLLRAHGFAVNRGKSVLYGTCARCAANEVKV
jgi:Fur family ferric uptake transcriptional regulator